VVLTRGGQGVQDLDTDELIGAVAAAAVPVAVALGHATDDLVLNRVADVSFPTPTAFGAWLRGVVDEKRDRARQAAAEAAGGAGPVVGCRRRAGRASSGGRRLVTLRPVGPSAADRGGAAILEVP
jgi:exodeoxyribonuclease VII large subunit